MQSASWESRSCLIWLPWGDILKSRWEGSRHYRLDPKLIFLNILSFNESKLPCTCLSPLCPHWCITARGATLKTSATPWFIRLLTPALKQAHRAILHQIFACLMYWKYKQNSLHRCWLLRSVADEHCRLLLRGWPCSSLQYRARGSLTGSREYILIGPAHRAAGQTDTPSHPSTNTMGSQKGFQHRLQLLHQHPCPSSTTGQVTCTQTRLTSEFSPS